MQVAHLTSAVLVCDIIVVWFFNEEAMLTATQQATALPDQSYGLLL